MQSIKQSFKKFSAIAGGLSGLSGLVIAFVSSELLFIFLLASLISYVFTASNFFVINKITVKNNRRFFAWFMGSFALRFFGVIITLILVVKTLNSHQIFFTVSFIISYICYSVIEIIFINYILKTDT